MLLGARTDPRAQSGPWLGPPYPWRCLGGMHLSSPCLGSAPWGFLCWGLMAGAHLVLSSSRADPKATGWAVPMWQKALSPGRSWPHSCPSCPQLRGELNPQGGARGFQRRANRSLQEGEVTLPVGHARCCWAGALRDPLQVTDDETIVQEHRVVCVGAATQVGYRCMPVFKFCIVHLLSLILNHVEGRSAGVAVPLLSRPAGTGIGVQLTRLLPVGPVAVVWLFPSDQ